LLSWGLLWPASRVCEESCGGANLSDMAQVQPAWSSGVPVLSLESSGFVRTVDFRLHRFFTFSLLMIEAVGFARAGQSEIFTFIAYLKSGIAANLST
jgi:hypothetical protein